MGCLGRTPKPPSAVLTPSDPGPFPTRPSRDLDTFLDEHAGFDGGHFVVSDFHLYRSTLRPEGALHEIVESYQLT